MSSAYLNVTETPGVDGACTIIAKRIVFGGAPLPATHALPKPSLIFLENVDEL